MSSTSKKIQDHLPHASSLSDLTPICAGTEELVEEERVGKSEDTDCGSWELGAGSWSRIRRIYI